MKAATENFNSASEPDKQVVYLKKKIGLVGCVALILGTMIGSGIFITPRGVLETSGTVGISLIVWLICGILSTFGALCYAELGTSITKSGGHYTYLLQALGPLPAFLRLWSDCILISPGGSTVMALGFGNYIVQPFYTPCQAPLLPVKLLAAAAITAIIVLNSWSVRWMTRIQIFFTVIKLGTIALIIVPGMTVLAQGHYENFQNAFDSSAIRLEKLPQAFYFAMFTYAGWFHLTSMTEEIINPCRNIPLSIVLSMATAIVLYLLTNIAYYTVLTKNEILHSDVIVVSFTDRTLKAFSSVISYFVALCCFGSLTAGILSTSRMLFVASREETWPVLFSMIHIRRHTPIPSLLLLYPLILLMIASSDISSLLNISGFVVWLFTGLVGVGLIKLRYSNPKLHRPIKIPIIIIVVFSGTCFFVAIMALYSNPVSSGIGCVGILTGLPVYYLLVKKQQMPVRFNRALNNLMLKFQILLEVIPQEIPTY